MKLDISSWEWKATRLFAAAMLAASLAACAGSPTKESTGEFFDDSTITMKVKTALLDNLATRGLDVHVSTFKGAVELSGFVNSRADRKRAEEVANSIDGVRAVANGIVVRSSS